MESDKDTESEVKSVIERFFRAPDSQDTELFKRLLPRDSSMVHVGTDKDEIWKGYVELKKATEEQFDNLEYYKASIRDLTVNISASNDVAWYFHLLDAEIKTGEKLYAWEGARFTGVLEKRNGEWAMVQTHVSLPVSGSY